jgi:hypothetical protein
MSKYLPLRTAPGHPAIIRAAGVLNPPTRCPICGLLGGCDPAAHIFADAAGPSQPRTYDELIADARKAIQRFEAENVNTGSAS